MSLKRHLLFRCFRGSTRSKAKNKMHSKLPSCFLAACAALALTGIGRGVEIPRVLDELVQRLLRKDPRNRYQSAEAVLADLEALSDALEHGQRDPALVVGARDRRCTLTEPAFVARTGELQQFGLAVQNTDACRSAHFMA